MSSELVIWSNRLRNAIATLRRPGDAIKPPPPGEAGLDRLKELWRIRQLFLVDESVPNILATAAERFANHATGLSMKDRLQGLATDAIGSIDAEIAKSLNTASPAELYDLGIIRTADFADGVRWMNPELLGSQSTMLAIGLLATLPNGHLLSTWNANDYFAFEGRASPTAHSIVLGFPQIALAGPVQPRPFYALNSARHLTDTFRTRQHYQEEEAARRRHQQELQDQRQRQARENPLEAEVMALKKRIAELERNRSLQTIGGSKNAPV